MSGMGFDYNNWEREHDKIWDDDEDDGESKIKEELAEIEEKLQEARNSASSFNLLDYADKKDEYDEIEKTVASLENRKKELQATLEAIERERANFENN